VVYLHEEELLGEDPWFEGVWDGFVEDAHFGWGRVLVRWIGKMSKTKREDVGKRKLGGGSVL
jgi:hypothetical protein